MHRCKGMKVGGQYAGEEAAKKGAKAMRARRAKAYSDYLEAARTAVFARTVESTAHSASIVATGEAGELERELANAKATFRRAVGIAARAHRNASRALASARGRHQKAQAYVHETTAALEPLKDAHARAVADVDRAETELAKAADAGMLDDMRGVWTILERLSEAHLASLSNREHSLRLVVASEEQMVGLENRSVGTLTAELASKKGRLSTVNRYVDLLRQSLGRAPSMVMSAISQMSGFKPSTAKELAAAVENEGVALEHARQAAVELQGRFSDMTKSYEDQIHEVLQKITDRHTADLQQISQKITVLSSKVASFHAKHLDEKLAEAKGEMEKAQRDVQGAAERERSLNENLQRAAHQSATSFIERGNVRSPEFYGSKDHDFSKDGTDSVENGVAAMDGFGRLKKGESGSDELEEAEDVDEPAKTEAKLPPETPNCKRKKLCSTTRRSTSAPVIVT